MQSNHEMSERLSELFEKHISGHLTENERIELMGLFLEPSLKNRLQELVSEAWHKTGEDFGLSEDKKEVFIQKILETRKAEVSHEENLPENGKSKVIEVNAARGSIAGWRPWAVAASIVLLLGAATLWIFNNSKNRSGETITIAHHDVEAPKNSRARVTLANGRKIDIDSLTTGQIAIQGGVKLVKLGNGQIAYEPVNDGLTSDMQYNTVENPRGSKVIDATLSDGTRVWLNAGSSLTFPVAFLGKERNVTITGEAYFEVAQNAAMPFTVGKDEVKIKVLGTRFNVNAYNDNEQTKITLLEGSVKTVLRDKQSVVLKPGQQADITNQINILQNIDVQEVMAWKDGMFRFKNANIEEIMRQVARWYDVEIVYKTNVSDMDFGGTVSRKANISELLKQLETTEMVSFKVEGRKVTVMPFAPK